MQSHHLTASTSREAYRNLDVKDQHDAILNYLRAISPESSCIADIAHVLGWEKSTVSPRLNELKNMGLIEYDGKKPSKRTGIKAIHWKVPEQESLFRGFPGVAVVTRNNRSNHEAVRTRRSEVHRP